MDGISTLKIFPPPMIQFKDFVPVLKFKGDIFKGPEYWPLEGTMKHVNEWIATNPTNTIINIETVIMPNESKKGIDETESKSTKISPSIGRQNYYYYQVVRVWYRED